MTEAQWAAKASKLLVGRKITAVSYFTREEATQAGFNCRPLLIQLDGRDNAIYSLSDDEGNDGGALEIIANGKPVLLPVLQ